VKILFAPVIPVHVMPSLEYAIEFVPEPTATHRVPYHATPFPFVEKIVTPLPVQENPSFEYAIEFVPEPTATHRVPDHATPFPCVEKIAVPVIPVHDIPSLE
jgi:hypothetical protein